jgi:hypothetical protein
MSKLRSTSIDPPTCGSNQLNSTDQETNKRLSMYRLQKRLALSSFQPLAFMKLRRSCCRLSRPISFPGKRCVPSPFVLHPCKSNDYTIAMDTRDA